MEIQIGNNSSHMLEGEGWGGNYTVITQGNYTVITQSNYTHETIS